MRNRLKTGSEKSGKKAVSPSLPDKYVSSFLRISQQLKHAFNVMEKHIPEKRQSRKTSGHFNNRNSPFINLFRICRPPAPGKGCAPATFSLYGKHTVMKTYQKNGDNKKRHPPFRRMASKILRRLG